LALVALAGAIALLMLWAVPAGAAGATPTCGGVHATITGTAAGDSLRGAAQSDAIFGGRGHDRLRGKGGSDRLCGGPGPDRLVGGAGRDRVNGGRGYDTCVDKTEVDRMIGCEQIVTATPNPGLLAIKGIFLDHPVVQGGVGMNGVVTVTYGAGSGAIVTLETDNPARVSVPSTAQVLPGLTWAQFPVSTTPGPDATVNLTASVGSSSFTRALTLRQQVTLVDLTVPATVAEGGSDAATVTLDVPTAGATVQLQSSDPSSATVPPSVDVPAGKTEGSFRIDGVQADPSVTITATLGSVSLDESVAVVP
jgi:hypothetical protein